MAYNNFLAERIALELKRKKKAFEEKKMFGGICYMVDEKMCVGVVKDQLMARVGVDAYEECLTREHCCEMMFTGRAMKGYVFVSMDGIDLDEDLSFYIKFFIFK